MMRQCRHCWWIVLVVSAVQAQDVVSVETYVRQRFLHGVPYLRSRQWNSDADVGRLIEMLAADGDRAHWTKIVAVLGIGGNDAAFCPLLEFLSRQVQSPDANEAALGVPLALGYLVNSKGTPQGGGPTPASDAALRVLISGVEPAFWGDRWQRESTDICRNGLHPVFGDEVRRALARRSVLGLALSGHREAVSRLDELSILVARGDAGAKIFSDLLPEMAETAREIAGSSLARYYEKSSN